MTSSYRADSQKMRFGIPSRFLLPPSFSVRLYAGILSFVCAETLTGSSLYWVLNPFVYIVVFPLYLLHILFFYSLAHHLKRDSLPDLYIFGMLFGLYESWVTKVLWAGYPDKDHFILGSFLGHGIHETAVLVFYFHSFVSFIFPLVIIGSIFPQTSDEIKIQNKFYGGERLYKILFWFSFTVLSLGPSQHFASIFHPFLHWIPTLILAFTGYRWVQHSIKKAGNPKTITFALSVRGTIICGILILLLYIVTYTLFLPEKTPALWVHMVTILLYVTLLAALLFTKPTTDNIIKDVQTPTARYFFSILILMTCVTTLIAIIRIFIPQSVLIIASIGFLMMMFMGFILLWRLTLTRFIKHQ